MKLFLSSKISVVVTGSPTSDTINCFPDTNSSTISQLSTSPKPMSSRDSSSTIMSSPNQDDERSSKGLSIEERVDKSIVPLSETMSCQIAFDQATRCAGIAGRFRYNYRYGGVQSCSPLWSDFWFCMRSRSMPDDIKRANIKDRYKQKEVVFLSGPNCEDVWEERDTPVENFAKMDLETYFKER